MPSRLLCGLRASLLAGVFLLAACAGAQTTSDVPSEPAGSYPPAAPPPVPGADATRADVRAVLDAQVEAWNRGDVRGFMAGYARHDSLVFISGGTLRRGWQDNLYAYMRNYPDQAAMGTLSFENVHVRPLTADYALAYGTWRLRRADDEPLGLFSLLFHLTDDGWRIMHDHTSSAP